MQNRIKLLRKSLNQTQNEFAASLNLSRNFITLIENGTRVPSDRTILDICKKYNVNEEWIREGKGEMYKPPIDERASYVSYLLENIDDPIANEIMHFMQIYLDLDEKDKTVLRNFVSKLHEKRTGK